MISVCNAVDRFGVPTAVVVMQGDRFLFANECFLQMVGLTAADLSTTSLLKIVRFPSNYRSDAEPVPVTIRPRDRNLAIGGYIEFRKQNLAYVVIPSLLHREPSSYRGQDQQQPATRPNDQLPSALTVLDFSIGFIRARSLVENHSAGPEVKEIREYI
jgi:hypothetical protein